MDELAVLTRHRPDPPPPTDAERSAVRALVVAHARAGGGPGADPSPVVVDLAGRPGRTRRRVARALAVGAAAAIVVVAVVLARTGDEHDGAPADGPAGPTTAEPVDGPPGPFPALPYSMRVDVAATSTGGTEPRSVSGHVVVYALDDEVWIGDTSACEGCDPTMLMLRLGDRPPEGPVAEVRAAVAAMVDASPDPTFRLIVLVDALQRPDVGPVARAELLRALVALPGLEVAEGATTARGGVGTRYATSTQSGAHAVVVDPVDGYVLEESWSDGPAAEGEAMPTEIVTPAGSFSPDGSLASVLTYARPVALDAVPAEIARQAEAVRASPPPGPGSCSAARGNEDLGGALPETPIAPHLAFVHCPGD